MKKLILLSLLLISVSSYAQERLFGRDINEATVEMMNDTTYWLPIVIKENGFVSFRSELLMINENPVHSLALHYDHDRRVDLIEYVITGEENVKEQIEVLDDWVERDPEGLIWSKGEFTYKIRTGETGFGMKTAWMTVVKG